MDYQIVRAFYNYDAALRALNQLLTAGFERERMFVEVMKDEAGPGQANFTVGDDPKVKGGTDYNDTFRPEEELRHVVLEVRAPSASEADRAAAIMADHGGVVADPAWKKLAGE
jgi:hypothetical protein